MEDGKRRTCQYGAKCYRKNKKHLEEFTHPEGDSDSGGVTQGTSITNTQRGSDSHAGAKPKKGINSFPVTRNMGSGTSRRGRKLNGKLDGIKKRKNSCEDNRDKNETGQAKTKRIKTVNQKKTDEENISNVEGVSDDKDVDSYDEDGDGECNINDDVKSNSWTYIKVPQSSVTIVDSNESDIQKEDIIKSFYLVDMPSDFYSFYEFCKSNNSDEPLNVLKSFGLSLVGPFEILAGKTFNMTPKEAQLCHWRYYYDPPEFQTVLVKETGYHIGYWRDEPKEQPVFMASNNASENCIFNVESENIFGAVYHYLTQYIKNCDPFKKTKASKMQTSLKQWAEKKKFTLEKVTPQMKKRQKKVNSKTFHGAGMVVPVDETEVGYRPLIESDANIKKICKLIIDADDEKERQTLMVKLQPLINAANIANDECDFGNGLELGIDLFCMGSPVFHKTVTHLLTTAYSLLDRPEFEEIIKAHLKNRRKGVDLCII